MLIDLPQAVNAVGNNGAFARLEQDANNIRGTLGRVTLELQEAEFAREMWASSNKTTCPRTASSQVSAHETRGWPMPTKPVADAREEALRRELGQVS